MAASPYTLEGAREILAPPDNKALKALDVLLGVGLLAAGPLGLAPWGWVDQKNELIQLLGRLTSSGRERLGRGRTRDRGEVLAATHTALVYGAFFAALRQVVGPMLDRIGLTEQDRSRLTDEANAAGQGTTSENALFGLFTQVDIALPWAGRGFRQTRDTDVLALYKTLALLCVKFFESFAAWTRRGDVRPTDPLVRDIAEAALRRYEAEYKLLAAEVPEFEIWAMLGEHEATHRSLGRLEELMHSLAGNLAGSRTERANAAINRAVLDEPLLGTGAPEDLPDLVVPPVRDGYLGPPFRWTVIDQDSRPADEGWWRRASLETDLDTFLAAFLASPESHLRPLVVLGHPGSGKSMLTKVCSARLSTTDGFVAARIPLRQVTDPNAPIYQQVSSVLGSRTHGRVSWEELSATPDTTTRVLFIDGLDEFMQATGAAESNYLQNVVEFQRVERVTSGPVAVVVTSRTLVADLAKIPPGSLVIKLEDFSEDQVRTWLDVWQRTNARVKIPAAESVLSYGPIARQPLLLLLLVLFGAANELPPMDEDSTPAGIYGGILRSFIRRELAKPTDLERSGTPDQQAAAEMWRLGIAAFGMFNRGSHYIDEATLLGDLQALDPSSGGRPTSRRPGPLTSARRVLGKFFFIHSPDVGERAGERSYEFLHATFSEYLIAFLIKEELAELWLSRDRPSSQIWDDDRLYALLSHQLLDSGGAAILSFFGQLASTSDEIGEEALGRILRLLLGGAERRWGEGRFADYRPSEGVYLQRLATYTANLVMLLFGVERGPVTLSSMAPAGSEPTMWWTRMLRNWQGCLDTTFLEEIDARFDPEPALTWVPVPFHQSSVHEEWLTFSRRRAVLMNAGFGVAGRNLVIDSPDPAVHFAGHSARALIDPQAARGIAEAARALLADMNPRSPGSELTPWLLAYVTRHPELVPASEMTKLVAAEMDDVRSSSLWALALVVAQHPEDYSDSGFVSSILRQSDVSGLLTPLIAGKLVWGDDFPLTLSALPPELAGPAGRLMGLAQQLKDAVGGPRAVLMLADYLEDARG